MYVCMNVCINMPIIYIELKFGEVLIFPKLTNVALNCKSRPELEKTFSRMKRIETF